MIRQLIKMMFQRGFQVDSKLSERLLTALSQDDWQLNLQSLQLNNRQVAQAMSRSLLIRHLDLGSSNGEETELLGLMSAPCFDLSRFGIDFVASPRHADVLAVTGPVTRHLKLAMERTYAATPAPKLVIAIGDAACGKSIFEYTYACLGPVSEFLPVHLEIPGNPPDPETILQGLLLCKMSLANWL